jgi:hypothetical protein
VPPKGSHVAGTNLYYDCQRTCYQKERNNMYISFNPAQSSLRERLASAGIAVKQVIAEVMNISHT